MIYFVYILYSESTDTFYRGQTENLEDRIKRHNSGWEISTKRGIPWKLVWYTQKCDRSSAIKLERKLKNLTRERLIKFIGRHE